jgi:anti-sigma factor (TIGR02949 family)
MIPAYSRADCEAIVRRLWLYLDGRLPDGEQAQVAGHLAACRECASHFDFARAFLAALRDARLDGTSDDNLRERVLSALAAEGFRG